MRNLAGRLTARTNAELMRIAEFWQTVVGGRDRHAVVGQLYREMREVRSARDIWERLDDGERAAIRLMSLDDRVDERSWTLPELGAWLDRDEDTAREIAVSLYRKGLLYREGDDDELPVGELPRVFLPRELTSSFRRVQDEIDAGDLQHVPFSALLALLDDTELEHAASLWGVEVLPSLQVRDDLSRQIMQALEDPVRRKSVLASLSPDARGVWLHMMESGYDSEQLDSVFNAAGLSGEGIGTAQRRRNAIGQLEERLLAWHSYGTHETRALFVPAEIRSRTPRVERRATAPQPVTELVTPDPWIHRWAVPWDLLTLLREVSGGEPRIIAELPASRFWLEQIGPKLWNTGGPEHLANYLTFLAALGRNENVLQNGDDDGPDAALQPGRSWKQWRSRPFAEQFAHVVWWWTASPEWIEAQHRSGLIVTRAALPQFRRKMLALIGQLEPASWFQSAQVCRWIAEIDPDILGDEAAVATASALGVPAGHPDWSTLATSAVVQTELETAFAWFGLIETGLDSEARPVIRTTDMLRALQSDDKIIDDAQPPGPSMVISVDGTIELRAPASVRVWSLSAFAELQEFRPAATYRVTEESLRTGLARGPVLRDVIDYLESESGELLFPAIRAQLESWASIEKRVRVRQFAEIATSSDEDERSLQRLLSEAGWNVSVLDGVLRVELRADGQRDQQGKELVLALERAGFKWESDEPSGARIGEESGPDGS